MLEKEINENLVVDIARVLVVSGNLDVLEIPEGSSRKDIESTIQFMLNHKQDKKLYSAISLILNDCAESAYKEILSKTYISYVLSCLKYRMENPDNPVIERESIESELDQYIDDVIQVISEGVHLTPIGYRAYEIAGSKEALEEAILDKFPKKSKITVSVSVFMLDNASYVYREKAIYLGHPIWVTSQLLPIVLVLIES